MECLRIWLFEKKNEMHQGTKGRKRPKTPCVSFFVEQAPSFAQVRKEKLQSPI
jgi:hypothetical protein